MTNTIPVRITQETMEEIARRKKKLAEEYRILFGRPVRITYGMVIRKIINERENKK